jgi:hypothetical protein
LGYERADDVHPVCLIGAGGEVELTRFKDADEARLLASELASQLGMEYHAPPLAAES